MGIVEGGWDGCSGGISLTVSSKLGITQLIRVCPSFALKLQAFLLSVLLYTGFQAALTLNHM